MKRYRPPARHQPRTLIHLSEIANFNFAEILPSESSVTNGETSSVRWAARAGGICFYFRGWWRAGFRTKTYYGNFIGVIIRHALNWIFLIGGNRAKEALRFGDYGGHLRLESKTSLTEEGECKRKKGIR